VLFSGLLGSPIRAEATSFYAELYDAIDPLLSDLEGSELHGRVRTKPTTATIEINTNPRTR
jgi:hypothetical protein